MADNYLSGALAFGDNPSTAGSPLMVGASWQYGSEALSPLTLYSLGGDGGSQQSQYAAGNDKSFMSQLGTLATGYLSRRVDIDLMGRMAAIGTVGVAGEQRSLANYSTPRTGLTVATTGGKQQDLAPLLLLGLAAFFVLRKVL